MAAKDKPAAPSDHDRSDAFRQERGFVRLCRLAALDPNEVEVIDGEDGPLPAPPAPAFRLVVRGKQVARFSTHDLVLRILSTPSDKTPSDKEKTP